VGQRLLMPTAAIRRPAAQPSASADKPSASRMPAVTKTSASRPTGARLPAAAPAAARLPAVAPAAARLPAAAPAATAVRKEFSERNRASAQNYKKTAGSVDAIRQRVREEMRREEALLKTRVEAQLAQKEAEELAVREEQRQARVAEVRQRQAVRQEISQAYVAEVNGDWGGVWAAGSSSTPTPAERLLQRGVRQMVGEADDEALVETTGTMAEAAAPAESHSEFVARALRERQERKAATEAELRQFTQRMETRRTEAVEARKAGPPPAVGSLVNRSLFTLPTANLAPAPLPVPEAASKSEAARSAWDWVQRSSPDAEAGAADDGGLGPAAVRE